jgi:hypothetical protein
LEATHQRISEIGGEMGLGIDYELVVQEKLFEMTGGDAKKVTEDMITAEFEKLK